MKYAGPVLQALRMRSGLTQKELAVRLGRDRITVLRWENGHAVIPLDTFLALCEETGGDPVRAIEEMALRRRKERDA